MAHKVLIIEDDPDIAALVDMNLRDIDCHCEIASDGETGLEYWRRSTDTKPFDLVVLDLMLPGLGGLEVCQAIRRDKQYVPILMLTARTSEPDRVLGLETGADDYLAKPFGIPELQARIKALFRRVEALSKPPDTSPASHIIEKGNLYIDPDRHIVRIDNRPVELTAREFDLLHHFARHPDRVYSRAQLLDQVWGYNHDGYEHTVNTHINRLRAKIEKDPAKPVFIQTVWGVGYKFGGSQESSEAVNS